MTKRNRASFVDPPIRTIPYGGASETCVSVPVGIADIRAVVTNIPLRVCIVDDDDAVRDSLGILLDAHGIDVESFPTPSRFLQHAGAIAADCLVFDLHMPEMSGLELAETIRDRRMAMPVILITGRGDIMLPQRMEKAGVAAVLPKPVSDDDLIGAIRQATSRIVAASQPGGAEISAAQASMAPTMPSASRPDFAADTRASTIRFQPADPTLACNLRSPITSA